MATEKRDNKVQTSSCAVCRGDKNISIVASHTCKFIYAIEDPGEVLDFMDKILTTSHAKDERASEEAPNSNEPIGRRLGAEIRR